MIKRISVSELQIGMYIAAMDNSWVPNSNTSRQGILRNDATIKKIQSLGIAEVCIDISKGSDNPAAVPVYKESFADEFLRAKEVHGQTKNLMSDLLANVKNGQMLKLDDVAVAADQMLDSLASNPHALMCLGRLRSRDEYLLEHSVNVATLMGLFSAHCGYGRDIQMELVTGALLHDIGKINVPDEILNKPGKLTDDEWVEMKRHVNHGVKALDSTVGITPIMKSICAGHHEKLDGTGYPNGLSAVEISKFIRMSSICDIYDAMTADRVYKEGMEPTKAMSLLVSWGGDHLDKNLVYEFIRAMSIYPAGSVVELDDGCLGFVVEPNTKQQNKPVVEVFYSLDEQQKIEKQRYDLLLEDLKIVRAVDISDYGMRLGDIILPEN